MAITIDNLSGVHRRTAQKIRRGKVEIDATVDLHGQTVDEATVTVNTFLGESVDAGLRMLLVITGKGDGILRAALPTTLADWSNQIIAVATAHAHHGGEGAFYVLLKRPRDAE